MIWAGFPTVIVLLILAPSLYLLYSLDEELDPSITVKVIGHQWFWTYELNNWLPSMHNKSAVVLANWACEYDSVLITEEFLVTGFKRLLEVNRPLVIPINLPIRFLITSTDVLHSWSVPELGLKIDAVPGRLNQFVSVICRPGRLYGQCSELCGVSHGFMPIVVDGVSFKTFMLDLQNLTKITQQNLDPFPVLVKNTKQISDKTLLILKYFANNSAQGVLFRSMEAQKGTITPNLLKLAIEELESELDILKVHQREKRISNKLIYSHSNSNLDEVIEARKLRSAYWNETLYSKLQKCTSGKCNFKK